MMRYEVTMEDGWKTHVTAESPQIACDKASRFNKGRAAVSVAEILDDTSEAIRDALQAADSRRPHQAGERA